MTSPHIGRQFQSKSDKYGSINYLTVAKINWKLSTFTSEFLDEQYQHPKECFSAYSTSTDDSCFSEEARGEFAFFVSLPFDIGNKDWWKENEDCLYRQDVKRKPRKIGSPTCNTLAQYKKWMTRNIPAFEAYLTVEEIQDILG